MSKTAYFCLAACTAAALTGFTAILNITSAQAGRTDSTPSDKATHTQKYTKVPGTLVVARRTRPTGRNVIKVRYPGGVFTKLRGRNWVEQNRDGRHHFRERARDDWSVYLYDASRDVSIQLDLHRREIFYSQGGSQRQVLYRITDAVAKQVRHTRRRARNNTCRQLGGRISRNSNVRAQVTFINRSGSYRSVVWVDFQGGRKQYASLNPGQSYTINTFVTHPWVLTDGPGNCIEMYMPRPGRQVFTLTAPNRNFGRE